jgi:hypothetical protein
MTLNLSGRGSSFGRRKINPENPQKLFTGKHLVTKSLKYYGKRNK